MSWRREFLAEVLHFVVNEAIPFIESDENLHAEAEQRRHSRRIRRRLWTHPYLERRERSFYRGLFMELSIEDPFRFRRCLRMNETMFVQLLRLVSPLLMKRDTNMRLAIPVEEKLAIGLRYLATGETQEELRASFRVGQSTISGILRDVTSAIINVLQPRYLTFPRTPEEWKVVESRFDSRWNFPHVIGALDGKHVRIEKPIASGSSYHNYKDFNSIILFAAVDADLRFIYVDVGTNGRVSDTGVWNKCDLKKAMDQGSLNLPPPEPIVEGGTNVPYFFIADEGLPLSKHMLTPYPLRTLSGNTRRRIYNYRLSRARMNIECAFGVLSARFQIFHSAMRCDPDEAQKRVLACCCIHNWLRTEEVGRSMYAPPNFIDVEHGEWRLEQPTMNDIQRQGLTNNRTRYSLALREVMCDYFNGPGAVPQQDRVLYG